MNPQNRDEERYSAKDQGTYEYRDPGRHNEDDGRYVYRDDYGSEKSIGLRMLPILLLLIGALATFIMVNKNTEIFTGEPEPEPVVTETVEVVTADPADVAEDTGRLMRGEAIDNKARGELTTFGAKDGATITAYGNWQQVVDNAGIADFYESQEINFDIIMMAMESDNGRLTYEKFDVASSYDEFLNFLAEMKSRSLTEGPETVLQDLENKGFTTIELSYLSDHLYDVELSQEDLDYFFNEYYMQEWAYAEYESNPNFDLITTFDAVINRKIVPVYDYVYKKGLSDYDSLRTYQASYKEGTIIHRLTIWGWESDFMENMDEFVDMIESFKPSIQ